MYGLPSFVLRDISQYCRVWQVVPFSLTFVKEDAFTSSSARRWAEIGEVARSAGGVRKYRPWRWQIQVSSPSAHGRWDRGSARRARGLNISKNLFGCFFTVCRGVRNVVANKRFFIKIQVYPHEFFTESLSSHLCRLYSWYGYTPILF